MFLSLQGHAPLSARRGHVMSVCATRNANPNHVNKRLNILDNCCVTCIIAAGVKCRILIEQRKQSAAANVNQCQGAHA